MPKVNCSDISCIYHDGKECIADEIVLESETVDINGVLVKLVRCMMEETLEG